MKLKLKLRRKGISDFEAKVTEAMQVTLQIATADQLSTWKLTAPAFLREMIAFAQSSPEMVRSLRKAIDGSAPGLDNLRQAVRQCVQFIRTPNCTGVPHDDRRLNFLFTDLARAELTKLHSSQSEMFAVALQVASEKHPSCFGQCEDSAKHAQKVEKLRARQARLFKELGMSVSVADMYIPESIKDGRPVTFKLSDGNVPIAPSDNAGERLVNYLLKNSTTKKRLS